LHELHEQVGKRLHRRCNCVVHRLHWQWALSSSFHRALRLAGRVAALGIPAHVSRRYRRVPMAKVKHDFTHCVGYNRHVRGGVEPLHFGSTEPWGCAKIMTLYFPNFLVERMVEGAAASQNRERLAGDITHRFRSKSIPCK